MIELIVMIAFVGFLTWVILQIPMPQPVKNLIIGLVIFVIVVVVLRQLGLVGNFRGFRFP